MIQRLQVKGLFGLYDYDISFPQKPAVKILTGPNGYGKTTLLMAVNHLYKGEFWYFHYLDFQVISVYLSEQDIEQRIVIKKQLAAINPGIRTLGEENDEKVFDDTDNEVFEELVTLYDKEENEIEHFTVTEEYIQSLILNARMRSYRDNPSQRDEELIAMGYDADDDEYMQSRCKNISLALQEYETRYLPAQRIFNRENVRPANRPMRSYPYEIDHVNNEIGRLYRRTQNEFAATSQRIDATYISRLIKREECYQRDELQKKLDALKKRIGAYKELNLFSNMELLDYSLDNEQSYSEFKNVLSLYVDDMNDKMDRFETLYKKISLYKRVVTNKVLSEKTIDFSDDGLTVTNVKGRALGDLHKLSSGEQNLLILYFNLIFKSNSKTILLIDEPENSLHVAWQAKMLEDYISMAETTGCQIVLATHSPTFVDGRWEITSDLYRQYKGKE